MLLFLIFRAITITINAFESFYPEGKGVRICNFLEHEDIEIPMLLLQIKCTHTDT